MASAAAAAGGKGEFDMQLKLLLLGDSGVGKTSLLMRFCDDKFSSTFLSTIGVDCKSKVLPIEGERVKLQIWDTAGQERFRTISMSFLRGAQGIALVFDLTDRTSFDHVRSWMKQVNDSVPDITMILLANKCDLKEKWAVTEDEVKETAKALGINLYFTSARTADNVTPAFAHLALEATKRALAKPKAKDSGNDGKVDLKASGSAAKASKGCCG